MSLATNGDFDKSYELSRGLLTTIARKTMSLSSTEEQAERLPPHPAIEGRVWQTGSLQEIWFRERPPAWAITSGFGPLQRTTRDMVTFAIRLDVHIIVDRLRTAVAGQVTNADVANDPQYASLRNLDFTAYIEVDDHIEIQTLTVATDRDRPAATVTVPCVVIDFALSTAFVGTFPRIRVAINGNSLRQNGIVILMMAAAELEVPGSGEQALLQLIADLTNTLRSAVQAKVQQLSDWRIPQSGVQVMYADTGATGLAIKRLVAVTLDESLLIGIDELAARGTSYLLSSSSLGPGQAIAVTLSNRYLLRNLIRPALISLFSRTDANGVVSGVRVSDFDPAEFCFLSQPVNNVPFADRTVTLTGLEAFVDSSSQVRILVSFDLEIRPGSTAHVNLDLHLVFSISRSMARLSQALVVTASLANPNSAVLSADVDVSWYWYLLSGVVGGPLGFGITGIINGVFQAAIPGQIGGGLAAVTGLPEVASAVPMPATLTRPQISLNSGAGTPSQATARGSSPPMMLLGALGHDLQISAGFEPLPDPLNVTFQIPDGLDSRFRIDGIGGPIPDSTGEPTGREWALPIDDAIALVDAGNHLQVALPDMPPAPIESVYPILRRGVLGVPFLRTVPDNTPANNLANLPKRVAPAAPTVLGPEAPQ